MIDYGDEPWLSNTLEPSYHCPANNFSHNLLMFKESGLLIAIEIEQVALKK